MLNAFQAFDGTQKLTLAYVLYILHSGFLNSVLHSISSAVVHLPRYYSRNRKETMTGLVQFGQLSCYTACEDEARFIYKEIFDDGCYDVGQLSDAPFVVDVGANIGFFTLYVKHKYPAAKVLAFEPAPETFKLLERNISLHEIEGVEAIQCALGSQQGIMPLTYFPNLPGNSTLMPEEKEKLRQEAVKMLGQEAADARFGVTQTTDVTIERLSSFLDKYPNMQVDLVKVDVEGAELDVIRGIDESHWAMIRNIVIETWEPSGHRGEIERLLESKGFDVSRSEAEWAPGQFYMIRGRRTT